MSNTLVSPERVPRDSAISSYGPINSLVTLSRTSEPSGGVSLHG